MVRPALGLITLLLFPEAAATAQTGRPITTVTLPGSPFGIAPTADGQWVFVAIAHVDVFGRPEDAVPCELRVELAGSDRCRIYRAGDAAGIRRLYFALSRFANRRNAPGTPAGNSRNQS